MLFKKIVSLVLYILIFSFIGILFGSMVDPEYYVIPKDEFAWIMWMQDNWAIVALVLSEIAGLLPGKPKGILQAAVLIITKIFESKVPPKNRRLK